jgi:enoyl-CoA hydratase/carnithine racemase
MPDRISLDISEGVAFATVDSPPINLLDAEVLGALASVTERVANDEDVRVLVLQSANPEFFIAHGDVTTMVDMPSVEDPVPSDELSWVHATLDTLRTMPRVTIAKVEGLARGGGSEVALACDMRFAALDRAVFGQPEVGLGILPGAGGTARLTRLLGRARASEVIFGGDDFSAAEAERIGWVNRALPAAELGAYVDALALRIARFPSEAIAEIKRVMGAVEAQTAEDLMTEQYAFDRCMTSPEPRVRMRRWIDRGTQTPEGERTLGADLPSLADPDATRDA